MQKIEALVEEISSAADPRMRASALELVQSLMELHGAAIERALDIAWEAGEAGRALIDDFARDDLVASLLLLYGLHPLDIEARVADALEKARPHLRSRGAEVELLGVADAVVRLRLESRTNGCGSSAQELKLALEELIYNAAPDASAVEIEVSQRALPEVFVPIERLKSKVRTPE